jgi:hypothetical protein
VTTVPIFHARVSADGRLELLEAERDRRRAWLQTLAGKDVDVIVRKHREQRTLDQNAYLHAVPVPMIAEEWGEDIEATKLLLLGECFGWRETAHGRIPVKPSTSRLSTEEFSHFIEWIVRWAAMPRNVCEHGFRIPLPNEAAA